MTITDNGWDSRAWLDGDWLHRAPRREEVRPRLLAETRLLPCLAPQLPLRVSLPEPTEYGVRHRLLVGERLGPWYAVHRGLLLDLPDEVDEALAGILAPL